MNLVLMLYTGNYDSEYINCAGSGNHYRAGKAEGLQQFQAAAGDVDELIAQGVAKPVETKRAIEDAMPAWQPPTEESAN